MKLAPLLCLTLLLLSLVACKPTTHIITSKEVAEKKGLYSGKPNSSSAAKTTKTATKNTEGSLTTRPYATLNEDDDYPIDKESTPYLVQQLIHAAAEYEGVRYRGGGTTRQGMDCSGLVSTVFKAYDITLPRSSHEMAKVGVKINPKEAQKGDLIFFKTNGRSVINHVGLITEIHEDGIIFIHSSVQRGVIFSSTKEPYYNKSFVQINRIW